MIKFVFYNKRRHNPYTLWVVFCTVMVLGIIALLLGSSWYFVQTTRRLEAPVTAVLQTNAAKIQEMQLAIDIVERAVEKRTAQ